MIGQVIGNYVIEQMLGAGGMGEVYLATHRRIGRRVAVKLLLPQYSADEDVLARFFNEARASSVIDHPAIVEILDCDVHASGRAYIVMELLDGESLRQALDRVQRFTADLGAAVDIVAQVADALAAAHVKGIVHRDLKPDNVFLTRTHGGQGTTVKVLDFGIAKLLSPGRDAQRTRTGMLLGTPLYMSPEQCQGTAQVDHRSDVYSLGCICFELFCGRPPFASEGTTDLLIAHVTQPPPRPGDLGVALPAELEDLILAMLAKDPAARPASMGEVAAALRALAARLPPATSLFEVAAPSRPPPIAPTMTPTPGSGRVRPTVPLRTPVPTAARTGTTLGESAGTFARSGETTVPMRGAPNRRLLLGVVLGAAAAAGLAFALLRGDAPARIERATPAAPAARTEPTPPPEPEPARELAREAPAPAADAGAPAERARPARREPSAARPHRKGDSAEPGRKKQLADDAIIDL